MVLVGNLDRLRARGMEAEKGEGPDSKPCVSRAAVPGSMADALTSLCPGAACRLSKGLGRAGRSDRQPCCPPLGHRFAAELAYSVTLGESGGTSRRGCTVKREQCRDNARKLVKCLAERCRRCRPARLLGRAGRCAGTKTGRRCMEGVGWQVPVMEQRRDAVQSEKVAGLGKGEGGSSNRGVRGGRGQCQDFNGPA